MKEEKERIYHSRRIDSLKIKIPTGVNGYHTIPIEFTKKEEIQFIVCIIVVHQPPNRTDFDIRFYAMDDENYHKWLTNTPNVALAVVPRVINAGINFHPQKNGKYHIILDNTYSSFAEKTVSIEIFEVWVKEKESPEEIEKEEKGATETEETEEYTIPQETESEELLSSRSKLLGWFEEFKKRKVILAGLLFGLGQFISTLAFLVVIGIMSWFLNKNYFETLEQISGSFIIFAIGGILLFALFYKIVTGEHIPMVQHIPSPFN